MVMSAGAQRLPTDAEYAEIERYCIALHPHMPNMEEWPSGWARREPALLYLVQYRVWIVVELNAAKRKVKEPKPFTEWLRESDRKAANTARREWW